MKNRCIFILVIALFAFDSVAAIPASFIRASGGNLMLGKKAYYFVGTNYWYGSLLGLEKDRNKGILRLRRELDFLKAHGVTNLRLMAGAEGSGLINAVTRVGPPLQSEPGKFDEDVLRSLDLILDEMGKRNMKAVIFLSNNWEWSGGFQQYLLWNKVVSDDILTKKPSWDDLRDIVAKFYSCRPCIEQFNKQAETVVKRTNKINGRKYREDPAIMAWELANEPRPMRPVANADYSRWIVDAARLIKSLDPNHLVTTGHEGWIGTQDVKLFENVHDDTNIDYLTIHIWPKNWGWFAAGKMAEGYGEIDVLTRKYIRENLEVAHRLNKPMVIEEFGLPRDNQLFDPASTTVFRDKYYSTILNQIGGLPNGQENIAGANFWAFGGEARPKKGQIFWQAGDPLMGDPPMEEQGLNSVFTTDKSTWEVIRKVSRRIEKN